MTDREKLVEILRTPIFVHELANPTEAVADYLLDNGVALVVHGRWEDDPYMWVCSKCHQWLEVTQGTADMNYCPNCGAKMDLED